MDSAFFLALAATAYAVLSEWLGENPEVRANSVIGLIMQLLRWASERYRSNPGAQARRTMTQVDDQARALQGEWSMAHFQEQIEIANRRRADILTQPDVASVDIQLVDNQVVLKIQYKPDAGESGSGSRLLGGAIEIRGPMSQWGSGTSGRP